MNATLKPDVVSEVYRSPVMDALKIQIPIALLCLLMLDGGHLARICAVAIAGHWLGILLVMYRRPHAPTRIDVTLIRWGFLGIFLPIVLQDLFW
jgi:hypothetical protein